MYYCIIVTVTFKCLLEGDLNLSSVSWSKDGRPISDSGRFTFAQDGNSASFTIPAALSTDSGTYSVTASDDRGQASWTFSLLVRIGDSTSGDVDVQSLIDGAQVTLAIYSNISTM